MCPFWGLLIQFKYLSEKLLLSKEKLRKVFLYSKGDMSSMRCNWHTFQNSFLSGDPDLHSVQENWDSFKPELTALNQHIPSKMSRSNPSKSWITRDVWRQARKKQKLYNKAKSSQKASDWMEYKNQQKQMHNKCRKNYWCFQNSMLSCYCIIPQVGNLTRNQPVFWENLQSRLHQYLSISFKNPWSQALYQLTGVSQTSHPSSRVYHPTIVLCRSLPSVVSS